MRITINRNVVILISLSLFLLAFNLPQAMAFAFKNATKSNIDVHVLAGSRCISGRPGRRSPIIMSRTDMPPGKCYGHPYREEKTVSFSVSWVGNDQRFICYPAFPNNASIEFTGTKGSQDYPSIQSLNYNVCPKS